MDRRSFVKNSAVIGAAAALPRFSFAQVKGSDRVKVALVGCGGRGTGAACNMIAADPNVKFVALGDLFNGRPDRAANKIYEFAKKTVGEAKASEIIDTSKVKKFVGWDNIDQVLAEDVDLVIDATPPVFRTPHYEKIVAAGKHAFLEKPGAVDVIQGRKMYELAKEAEKKGLCVVCGNQRRYDNRYQDLVKRMQDGEIGELLAGQCYWNNGSYIGGSADGGPWGGGKEGTEDTLEYQIRNWWSFIWTSGDHIVEQHVHNIDVLMWAFGDDRLPIEVTTALGGRSTDLPCPRFGDRFSHFAIDFDMGNGLRMESYCHQDPNTSSNVSERIVGSKGIFQGLRLTDLKGKTIYAPRELELDPYIAEHKYLLSAIRSGKRVNELKNLMNSNMAAIAGRMSAFSGKRLKYEWMVKKSTEDIVPKNVDLMGKTQDLSLKNPVSVPVPGKYKLV